MSLFLDIVNNVSKFLIILKFFHNLMIKINKILKFEYYLIHLKGYYF